jgi:lipopolysaccharide/colanic/teichoic acid biosynthesis glycosyltransferase
MEYAMSVLDPVQIRSTEDLGKKSHGRMQRARSRRSAKSAPRKMHSIEITQFMLHRECARAERSGSTFCLVVLDAAYSEPGRDELEHLLAAQVRNTDEIGYLDERRACALLPYTTAAGAAEFVGRISAGAQALEQPISVKMYVYPSQKDAAVFHMDETADHDGERPSGGRRARAESVEPLLVRPTPWWKRLLDIIVSATALIVFSPLLVAIALAIKLTSKGPVMFTQMRSGLGGRSFRIFKFRTMRPDADRIKSQLLSRNEQDGPAFKMKNDPRITRIGKLLRVTSLDELPQLFNILKGDMSLVGPRPLPISESQACDPWHRRRLDVAPGLTCIWQISGRGTVSFAEWARMDRSYIQGRSLLLDIKLLLLTVPAVLSRRGAK